MNLDSNYAIYYTIKVLRVQSITNCFYEKRNFYRKEGDQYVERKLLKKVKNYKRANLFSSLTILRMNFNKTEL